MAQLNSIAKNWITNKLPQTYILYLNAVTLAGIMLIGWGFLQVPTYKPISYLLILLLLAIIAQTITTSISLSDDAGITYQVAPAVSMAALPFFGPFGAVLVDAISAFALWLIKPADETKWKKSWPQLAFNIGMGSISIFIAGTIFMLTRSWFGAETILGRTLPWFIAAIINDQVNLWLLIVIVWLQHKKRLDPFEVWRNNFWAAFISITLMSVGGGILAFALEQFGIIGIAIFFLPTLLSGFAFRIYATKIEAYTENLEQIVDARTAELSNLNKRKDAYLAVLTHDMITPLTTMQLYAELIKEYPESTIENPDLAETMLRCQKSLLRLLRNILDIEKLNSGISLSMHKEHFDLSIVLRSVLEMMKVEATAKNIDLSYDTVIKDSKIFADMHQIERILLNLISNAVKYTQNGGSIIISLEKQNQNDITIEVKDTGYGIPEEELPYIFERFTRVERLQDKAIGTGLGLAVTQALVEAHEGIIEVRSILGEGSVFRVTFPISNVEKELV
ncbi:MAG: HAMP domain-containing histidine kinase [Chloroflexi bacterium]|nr:HAMP domain-containing histidine kinase [Chloroflexota bacterium]